MSADGDRVRVGPVPTAGEYRAGVAGLSDAEAAGIAASSGPNAIPEQPAPGVPARFLVQLRDPMILLLLGAAVLTVFLRDLTDLTVIMAVVVVNSTVGVLQELRAERALAALRTLTAPTARVRRNGEVVVRPAVDLVPGDVVLLDAGDIVPADGSLLESFLLQVDESALTGESVAADKLVGEDAGDSARAFAGTVVTRGRGVVLVTATGASSALGRIAGLLGGQRPRPTPLQARLRRLGLVLAVAASALSAVVMVSGLLRGRPPDEVVLTAVSLAVAAVPESLPAVVTLALALGARRMARTNAVVRRLPAVETLGSVTVLASDKTGTLTVGRMVVERLWVSGAEYVVSGSGYRPEGAVTPVDPAHTEADALNRLARDVVLCNDARLGAPDSRHADWWPLGDTTEVALLSLARKAGADPEDTRSRHPRAGEIPFDSLRRRMTTLHGTARPGEYLVVCKGAPEVLLENPELLEQQESLSAAREAATRLARDGFRVLAVADALTGDADVRRGERRLRLVGLVGITDPPRPDANRVVEAVARAGVKLVLITGDHPHTARTVAGRLGIDASEVVTGEHLDAGTAGLDGRRGVPSVFARTRPEQKLDVVAALQDRGEVVAMTGDGVNDAPALRRADIGVAMGASGTEVAKQAADLVITDDDLGTVVAAIGEGRRIYANIRTFLRYALSGGVAEILVMLLGPGVALAVPLLPAQILWVNLLTHGLPGVAIGAEPGDPSAMRRPPRPPQESVLGDGLVRQVAWTGVSIAVVSLAVGWWTAGGNGPYQTTVFLTLGLAQLGVALALRRGRTPGEGPVRFLDVAVLGAVVLQFAGVYLPPLAALLGTEVLSFGDVWPALVGAAVPGGLVAGVRFRQARR